MDLVTIADYIDDKCHNVTSTSWTCELLFMATTNGKDSIEMNILQFIAASSPYKQTQKRNVDCFKVYLHLKNYPSSGGISFNII